jgi:transcriptional regulator PpsR
MTTVNLAQPDITLLLDLKGVIQGVTVSNGMSDEKMQAWRGRAWTDTVADHDADQGTDKVRRMVEDALASGVSAFNNVTQRFPSGREIPIEYTTVRLGGNAGLIAVGRSFQAVVELQSRLVSAQHSMEQDYWKLREIETRYRLLFDASVEPVLVLDAETLCIAEANPAAIRALGLNRGWEFLSEMAEAERAPFRAMLQRVREQGRVPGIVVHLGGNRESWVVRTSLINSEPGNAFLLQLAPSSPKAKTPNAREMTQLPSVINRLPDAFVIIDREGVVRRANPAFLDLVEVGVEAVVLGEGLERWLRRPGADMKVMMSQLRRNGAVRLFTTVIQGELGSEIEVEISAGGDAHNIGIVLRNVSRRLQPLTDEQPAITKDDRLLEALGALSRQSDNVALPELVDGAVGIVERHFITLTLEQTGGNRKAAAELLGVSRQSLYTKLNRYSMDGGSKPQPE